MSTVQAFVPSPEAYRFRCCLYVPVKGDENQAKMKASAKMLQSTNPILSSRVCSERPSFHVTIVDYYAPSKAINEVIQREVGKKITELAGKLHQKEAEISKQGWGLEIKKFRVLKGLSTDDPKDWIVGEVSTPIHTSQTFLKTLHEMAVQIVKSNGCLLVNSSSQYEPHVSTHSFTPCLTQQELEQITPVSGEVIKFGISPSRIQSHPIDRLALPKDQVQQQTRPVEGQWSFASQGSASAAAVSSSAPAAPPGYQSFSSDQFEQRGQFPYQKTPFVGQWGCASSSATAAAESLPPPAKKPRVSGGPSEEIAAGPMKNLIEKSLKALMASLSASTEILDLSRTKDEDAELNARCFDGNLKQGYISNRVIVINSCSANLVRSLRLSRLSMRLSQFEKLLNGQNFPLVSNLDLSDNNLGNESSEDVDKILESLRGFKRVETFSLAGNSRIEFTDANVKKICEFFPSLKHLDISGSLGSLPKRFSVTTSDGRIVQVVNND